MLKKRKQRQGVAAVEFAIISPLLFLLLLGSIELSRGFMVQQVLTNASRVGARQASTLTGTSSSVSTSVASYTEGMGIEGTTVNVSPNPADAGAGDEISVTVSVPYSSVSWLPMPQFLTGSTLTATSVMRKEGFD